MLTDIEIAKSVKLRPINEVAAELGIHEDQVENYGRYIAKITTDKIDRNKFKNHHLILVTAISPTKLVMERPPYPWVSPSVCRRLARRQLLHCASLLSVLASA